MNDKGRLQDKIAVVTGAAHGIGRAIAELFAEAGARVWIADLDRVAGEQAAADICQKGGQATFMACDVSSAAEVRRVVAAMAEEANRIDIVCNNAAYLSKQWHACAEASEEEWDKSFRVSLLGAQFVTREALPLMVAQKSGSIINISSIQGLVGARSSVAYTTMKHALIGFTRSVAYDYGPHNIRSNAICPGAIQTRVSPDPGSELHQRQVSKTFLGRTGRPREVAHAALFLGSDESSYVTGAVLAVDGGWTAM